MYMEQYRVPIPEDEIRIKDGKVQAKVYSMSSRGRVWTTIGKLPETDPLYNEDDRQLMIPNGVYRERFASFYYEDVVARDPDNIPPFFRHRAIIGPYALFLGVATKSGLYDLLLDIFGVETANALLDIAMFYNWSQRVEIEPIQDSMQDYLVFSVRAHTPQWYQQQVEYGISEKKIQAFLRRWTQLRQQTAPGDTAIHIGATGADWSYGSAWLLQMGVLAACETGGDCPGMPLAYHLYHGFYPNQAAAQTALDLFRDLGLAPRRLIGTKPFCRIRILNLCDALHLPWLIELQSYYLGHETMLDRHEADLIQGRGTQIAAKEPLVAAGEDGIPLFDPCSTDPDRKGFVGFYCISRDSEKYRPRFDKKLEKTYREACAVLEQIQSGGTKYQLPIPTPPQDGNAARKQKPIAAIEVDDAQDDHNGAGNEYIDHTDYDSPEIKAHSILKGAVNEAGGPFYSVDRGVWNSLRLDYLPEEGRYRCVIDEDEAQYYRCLDSFIGLASSEPMDLQEMSDAVPLSYYLGTDPQDRTFSAMHAQLNNEAEGSFSAWFFVAYLSDIVRALLLPSFQRFQADPEGEIREEALRDFAEAELEEELEMQEEQDDQDEQEEQEEREKREPRVHISIQKMISWLDSVTYTHLGTTSNILVPVQSHLGVRGDVLEAAGFPLDSLSCLYSLVNGAEDPSKLRALRLQRRTIPVPYVPKRRGRPKGSKNQPKPDGAS